MKPTLAFLTLVLAALVVLPACEPQAETALETLDIGADQAVTDSAAASYRPAPGSNEMLRAPLELAEGLEVIISDVVIPPGAEVARHYHPGEEFLYVIEGSAVHVEEGKPDLVLNAGDAYVIPPRAEHAPRGGPEGARAVVFRVHVAGEPERTLVEPDPAP